MRYFLIFTLLFFSACSNSQNSDEVAKEENRVIRVAVAANVSFAIIELSKEFKKDFPNTDLQITLGSSGKLSAQIINKAPFDIFMSANTNYPEKLFAEGIGLKKPKIYANGSLVLLSMTERDFSNGFQIFETEKFNKIAIANPKTAPYGFASVEVLQNLGLFQKLEDKFVYGESIGQTFTYATKVTDIGFVAKSQLFGEDFRDLIEGKNWFEIPPHLYSPISQGALVLTENGKDFYNFLLSEKGKKVLKDFGYSF
ncbi:molybdenum ABC transporter, periplasmic molybdate-binding protein [Thiovulum sp. ES]|nr:molybdenum ABC transporter, periplasmic molybdate-binding protein [Thiovulum sp. ES]